MLSEGVAPSADNYYIGNACTNAIFTLCEKVLNSRRQSLPIRFYLSTEIQKLVPLLYRLLLSFEKLVLDLLLLGRTLGLDVDDPGALPLLLVLLIFWR